MIEFIKDKTCYFLVKRLLMNNKAVTFSGPYGWAEQKTTEQIKEFLIRENGKKAPHLNSQNTVSVERELSINKRSAHFVARNQGKIIAYVRLTPQQFELSALSDKFNEITKPMKGYWEISRLNTDSELANKSQIAGLIMLKAGLWLFSKKKGKGLTGVCTANRVPFFTKFGMRSLGTDSLRYRGGNYHLVFATKDQIIGKVLKQFFIKNQKVKGVVNVHRTAKRKA